MHPLPWAPLPVLPPRSALPRVTFCRALQPAGIEPPLHSWFLGLGCTLKSGLPQWRNVQWEQLAQGLPDSTSGEETQCKATKLNISTMGYVVLRMDGAGSCWCTARFLLRVWHPLSGSSYTQRQVPSVPANLLSLELNPALLLVLPHMIINTPLSFLTVQMELKMSWSAVVSLWVEDFRPMQM